MFYPNNIGYGFSAWRQVNLLRLFSCGFNYSAYLSFWLIHLLFTYFRQIGMLSEQWFIVTYNWTDKKMSIYLQMEQSKLMTHRWRKKNKCQMEMSSRMLMNIFSIYKIFHSRIDTINHKRFLKIEMNNVYFHCYYLRWKVGFFPFLSQSITFFIIQS